MGGLADSTAVARDSVRAPVATPTPSPAFPTTRLPAAATAETVWVTSPTCRFGFSTAGGQLVFAELLKYRSFAPA